ncbi:MAG: ATP-binding cassette domain-containing protein [Spirochaetales bacterium]|jgi:phospholipid/cholesterol/gamma-HCH transport system ATP-binding protein|nr:ATP-binding cassette domain-containing protein [Spirochaetales bacterium]
MDIIVSVRGLTKSFGDKIVLKDVDMDFPRGKVTSIIGQSGIGKSVLFKNIIGIMTPDSGSIVVDGEDITKLREREKRRIRRRFGYAFQDAALFDSMTVAENIGFPLREVLGMKDKKEMRRIVREKLEWINLPGIEEKYPSELSGGMRKRVGVARTLAIEPDILLFDEPTTGLDPVLGASINALIKRVNEEFGITCIVISHDIIGTFNIADRIGFIAEGAIRAAGSPDEVARTEHPVLRQFLKNSFTDLKTTDLKTEIDAGDGL